MHNKDEYLAQPEALLDGIELDDYIIAVYTIALRSKMDATVMGKFAAIEQSTGTWIRVPAETEQVRKNHIAKVLGVYEIPNFEYEVPKEVEERLYCCVIGFPVVNIMAPKNNPNFPLLLTAIIGNISMGGKLKLVDVWFPKSYTKGFKGPKFGIDGIRKLMNIPERPLLNNMVKPCTGHTCEVAGELIYKAAVGGCDVIKDDELIANAQFNTLEDRITKGMEAIDKANAEKKEKTLYTINITDGVPDIFEHADKMISMGANALMVNYLVAGLPVLKKLAEDPSIKVPIMAHMDFAGVWYQDPWSGVASDLTLGKFPRMNGADIIVIPAPYGKAIVVPERYFMNLKALRYPWQHINQTMPMPSGGITQPQVEQCIKEAGKDIMIGSGGGVHAHPDGPTAGARAFRQAIDAAVKGIPAKEYAKDHVELAKALGTWSAGKTKFQG